MLAVLARAKWASAGGREGVQHVLEATAGIAAAVHIRTREQLLPRVGCAEMAVGVEAARRVVAAAVTACAAGGIGAGVLPMLVLHEVYREYGDRWAWAAY